MINQQLILNNGKLINTLAVLRNDLNKIGEGMKQQHAERPDASRKSNKQ